MRHLSKPFIALALAVAPLIMLVAPVRAQAANATDAKGAGRFIDELADQAFAILREGKGNRAAVRAKFRQMMGENFALSEIGARLIRHHRATITPAQYEAYMAAFPDYVISTYSDRLYAYANSDLKVIRTLPRPGGMVDVFTRITSPGGGAPIEAIWAVKKGTNGRYRIANLTVSGVNLTLTQEADFTSYIQRNGFDQLIAFMRASGNKA